MNLAIRFDFGKKKFISYGHFYRVLKIYNYFKKKINFTFIIRHGDERFFKKHFDGHFLRLKKSFKQNNFVIDHLKKYKIKTIICDLNAGCNFISKLKNKYKLIGIKDNYYNLDYYKYIFYPHEYKKISNRNLKIYNGINYSFIEKNNLRKKHKLKKEIKNITICLGGSDNLDISKKVLDLVLNNNPKLKINLLIGPGYKKSLKKYKKKKIKIFKNLDNLNHIKKRLNCDLLITSGGQTMYESFFLGVPMICFGTSQHENKIISYYSKKGLLFKGDYLKIKKITKFYSFNLRKKIKKKIRKKFYIKLKTFAQLKKIIQD